VAIEKMPGAAPKVEWTLATILQLAAAGVLVLLSLLLCWLAFANWRFKSNLVEGYQEYDRGRPATARTALEAASSWRPLHTGCRELLAKLLCDEDKLDEARKKYQALKAQGHTVPQVNIGLGVITLKEVEAQDNPKAVEKLVGEAVAAFRSAGGTPEAEIGLGHCELVLARKLNDPAHYAKAQAIFAKIRTVMDQKKEFRADITRDGLIDYYTGLGKALASGDKVDDGARDAFRACFQYLPPTVSVLPLANVLALETRRFATFAEGADGLKRLENDLNALRNQGRTIWVNHRVQVEKERLREAWLMYSLAVAQAWGRAGNVTEMQSIVRDLQSTGGLEQRVEPLILDGMVRAELAVRDDVSVRDQESQVTKTQAAYQELVQKLPTDDANKERRLRAYNNLGWMMAWRGGYGSSEGYYQQAVQKLGEALRIAPDDYIANRNMAVVLKRFKKPPQPPEQYLEKCRAAAEKDKQYAEDFEVVKKYIEAK